MDDSSTKFQRSNDDDGDDGDDEEESDLVGSSFFVSFLDERGADKGADSGLVFVVALASLSSLLSEDRIN